ATDSELFQCEKWSVRSDPLAGRWLLLTSHISLLTWSRAGQLGRRWGSVCCRRSRRYMAIVTVALNGLPTGFADRVFQCCYSLLLRRGCAGHVEDFFLQNCAVQIVHAVAERDLRQR